MCSGMKSRTVVFALAVLCAPVWAQSVDDDAAKIEQQRVGGAGGECG